MASHDKGRPLPKFGDWDVNNPASADGFTVIFAKAKDEKKSTGTAANPLPPPRKDVSQQHQSDFPPQKKNNEGAKNSKLHMQMLENEKLVMLFLRS